MPDYELHCGLNSMFCSALGPVPSPFDCFLANRGLKTLHLRMRQHQINALAVARFLEKNPRVQRVIYPGMLGTNKSILKLHSNAHGNLEKLNVTLRLLCIGVSGCHVESFIFYFLVRVVGLNTTTGLCFSQCNHFSIIPSRLAFKCVVTILE